MTKKPAMYFVLALTIALAWIPAQAQSISFTYQGSLKNGGVPANGNFDIQLLIFDSFTGGTNLASANHPNVPVVNGVFTLTQGFGNTFTGPDRYLEIRVRPSGTTAYTTLTPRQTFYSSPYAIRSINAATADNAVSLGGFSAGGFIQNSASQQASSNFNVSGTGTANILNAATQYNLGGNRFLSTVGSRNTYAGLGAGPANTSVFATDNSFFGFNAGAVNGNTGGSNSFFGSQAGAANTDGGSNSFFGTSAGLVNSTADGNSFFGAFAGDANTFGNSNSFFGAAAGGSNVIGEDNSFFGRGAGSNNTTGNSNTYFGRSAGSLNAIFSENSFFGFQAGQSNTAASNSFFGDKSGRANTTGNFNAFFGASSGLRNTGGRQNTFIGVDAGLNTTTGDFNTFIGTSAGDTNTTGSSNTVIGQEADVASGNLSFATAIGAGATVSTSNTVVIGRSFDEVVVNGNFRVSGDALIDVRTGGAGVVDLCIDPNSDRLTYCNSSIRYKENVKPTYLGLDLVRRLNPVTFDWTANKISDIGLIAEEVNEIEPALVFRGDTGLIEGVKYKGLTVVLVNAVKEQQAEIGRQNEVISRQQTELDGMKKFICSQFPAAEFCQ